VGKDFAMGKDRLGNGEFLRKACAEAGVIFEQADFVQTAGHKVSSSSIRKALNEGNIDAVTEMLGRRYYICGKVVKGRQLGRKMGFPTANIKTDPHKILPRGIYAVEVFLGKETFKGVCNIGSRPTVELHGLPSTEVHILDFDRNIYGRNLGVNFAAKIRDEIKFDTLGELVQQINKDTICAYKILK
jgi:FAD synthase